MMQGFSFARVFAASVAVGRRDPAFRVSLYGQQDRIAGQFFEQWKDAGSFKHQWEETVKRAGLKDLIFQRTFATWLTQCGVDYAVIRDAAW